MFAKTRRSRRLLVVALIALVSGALLFAWRAFDPGRWLLSQQQRNDDLIAEQLAYHIGTLAYLYGYPIVDMLSQMHNETHRVASDQMVYAPVNRFFRFPGLITPGNSGNLRAPNADTLYFSAWYDISDGPVVLSTPDTRGRYFTIAVTNLYAEVTHIGRRTTGTLARQFALVPPDWHGALPDGVQAFPVDTERGWLLGRMYVSGPSDLDEAAALVDAITLSPLSRPSDAPPEPELNADALRPHDSLQFFAVLDGALRELPLRPGEAAMIDQFAQIGLGGERRFAADLLDVPTRRGLERAITDGAEIVAAATRRSIPSFNGWMISDSIGRYGYQYMHRASVAKGGYGNLPEESLYPAAVFDADGQLLSSDKRYKITFEHGQLPPVTGFWSLTAYDLFGLDLAPNSLDRFNIGDRTSGLRFDADGSLTLTLQREPPADGVANWLPLPEGYFMLVMRLYEPGPEALDRRWQPPLVVAQAP